MKLLLLFVFCISFIGCMAQPSATIAKKIKTLDIKDYKFSQKAASGDTKELVRNDTVFTFSIEKGVIRREASKTDENKRIIEVFDNKSLQLISEITFFFNFPVGIYKKYDLEGSIVEEINYETNYPVSVDDIIAMVKTKFKVDLSQKNPGLNVTRGEDSTLGKMVYTVFISISSRSGRYIVIDARDGQLLSDQKVTAQE